MTGDLEERGFPSEQVPLCERSHSAYTVLIFFLLFFWMYPQAIASHDTAFSFSGYRTEASRGTWKIFRMWKRWYCARNIIYMPRFFSKLSFQLPLLFSIISENFTRNSLWQIRILSHCRRHYIGCKVHKTQTPDIYSSCFKATVSIVQRTLIRTFMLWAPFLRNGEDTTSYVNETNVGGDSLQMFQRKQIFKISAWIMRYVKSQEVLQNAQSEL